MGKMKADWEDDNSLSLPVIELEDDNFTAKGSLIGLSDDEAAELVADWFLHFFSDPSHEMPYNSELGGYQFVYGGPYKLELVLNEIFDGKTTQSSINLAIEKINSQYDVWEWAPSPMHPDQIQAAEEYHEFAAEQAWLEENDPYTIFCSATKRVSLALNAVTESKIYEDFFCQMLFVQSFSVIEAFLFDLLKKLLAESDEALKNFSRSDSYMSKISFSPEQILNGKADVRKAALGSIQSRVFHRFESALLDYKSAAKFEIAEPEFKAAIDNLKTFLPKRNNCVHRDGKDFDGNMSAVSKADVVAVQKSSAIIAKAIDAYCPGFELPF